VSVLYKWMWHCYGIGVWYMPCDIECVFGCWLMCGVWCLRCDVCCTLFVVWYPWYGVRCDVCDVLCSLADSGIM